MTAGLPVMSWLLQVELCQRLDEQHDWTTCPFMHPGEKARRRNPRAHKYDGVPCPDFRKVGWCKAARIK